MTDEGCYALAEAIILQAVEDYRTAYLRLKKRPDDVTAAKRVRSLTEFFHGSYFSTISDLDGPLLLQKLRVFMDEGNNGKTPLKFE